MGVGECIDCQSAFRVDFDNGYLCAGLPARADRLCDAVRLCQWRGGMCEIAWDLAPDEAQDIVSALSVALAEWMDGRRLRPCVWCEDEECKHKEEVREIG